MVGGSVLKRSLVVVIQSVCLFAFIVQVTVLFKEQLNPSRTEIYSGETQLDEIDFPVVFKVCFKNSFNLEKVREAGYENVWNYFKGTSRFDSSVYGWGGHTENEEVGLGVSGKGVCTYYE